MAIPAHTINIYQRPLAGSAHLRRDRVFNYRHKINAVGGFDTASCDIVPKSQADGDDFLEKYLGSRIAIHVDNPAEPVWEGFINRITFGSSGGTAFTISLDEMINRVAVKYSTGGALQSTTPVNDTASQAVYGIKQGTVDLGYFQTNTSTRPANVGNTLITNRAWPKASAVNGAADGIIHLELLGWYHTLRWQDRVVSSVANGSFYNIITNAGYGILVLYANGNAYFDNTDFRDITNNTVTSSLDENRGKTFWDALVEVQEAGDASFNYYVVGLTPTDFNSGKRRLYYRPANYAIKYTARRRDNLRLLDLYRRKVSPWEVRPDCGVRITDWLGFGAVVGDDPRESYISVIEYDANHQTVIWAGDDNITAEGAFQLNRFAKPFGKRFGAPPRANDN